MTTVPDWVLQYVVPVVAAALVWVGKRYLSQPHLVLARKALQAIIDELGTKITEASPEKVAEEAAARVEAVTGKAASLALLDKLTAEARKLLA